MTMLMDEKTSTVMAAANRTAVLPHPSTSLVPELLYLQLKFIFFT